MESKGDVIIIPQQMLHNMHYIIRNRQIIMYLMLREHNWPIRRVCALMTPRSRIT